MLKKLTNNKKGFSLVEILVAVTILGIIVGPLLISLYRNNYVIEQARKETEATYVAKKVMEETLAGYYSSISGDLADEVDGTNTYTTCMSKLIELLEKNSSGNQYTSSSGYKSRYADKFTYEVKIVPSGKNGLGISDSSANYLHIYTDKFGTANYVYVVFPNGELKKISPSNSSLNNFVVNYTNSKCSMSLNGSTILSGSALNPDKGPFRIVSYSSNDATSFQYNFDASTSWPNTCDRFLINYTSRAEATQVKVTADTDFISTSDVYNYYSSDREQWDIALYEITVDVYEGRNLLSSVESVIEVRIFPELKSGA